MIIIICHKNLNSIRSDLDEYFSVHVLVSSQYEIIAYLSVCWFLLEYMSKHGSQVQYDFIDMTHTA